MSERLKFYTLYALIAATSLPFIAIMQEPLKWTPKSAALYVSAFCGYIGIGLLLWMYVLGTRSVAGLFIKDLPRAIKVHNWLGKYGVLLIFLHPFLVAYNYGQNLITYTFWPSLSSSSEKHISYGRVGFMVLLIIWLTSAIVRGKIAYRPWKYIHYISYIVLPLSFLHVPRLGTSFGEELVQLYWYSFILVFLVFTVLRMRHLFGYGKLSYKLVEHKQIAPRVYMMRLRTDGNYIHLKPGQYVYLQLGLLHEEHPFTVLDYDNDKREMVIAYKVYGSYTKKMSALLPGATLLVDGPYGTFTEEVMINSDTPSVFIAGGIGITPFVKHVKDDTTGQHWVFYSNKTKDAAVFRSYLKQKLGNRYVDILSQDNSATSLQEVRGRLNGQVLANYLQQPSDYDYYICGPIGFIATAKQSLQTLGINPSRVHAEEFEF